MRAEHDATIPTAFELERFDWAGPDRLEISGTFTGPPPAPPDGPLLVVHGEDGAHELPPAGPAATPQPGELWRAAFAWQEPPAAFTTAELRLGAARVDLPGLHPGGEPAATLAVVGEEADAAPAERLEPQSDAAPAERLEPQSEAAPAGRLEPEPEGAPAGRLHLEAELLAGRELARELERELQRAHAERERAQEDLEAERTGRAEDAARFREGLAAVERAAADELATVQAEAEAAAMARAEVERLRAELDAAGAREAELRARLGASAGELEQALGRLLAVIREPELDGRAGRK